VRTDAVIHATAAELQALLSGRPGTGGDLEGYGPLPQNALRQALLNALADKLTDLPPDDPGPPDPDPDPDPPSGPSDPASPCPPSDPASPDPASDAGPPDPLVDPGRPDPASDPGPPDPPSGPPPSDPAPDPGTPDPPSGPPPWDPGRPDPAPTRPTGASPSTPYDDTGTAAHPRAETPGTAAATSADTTTTGGGRPAIILARLTPAQARRATIEATAPPGTIHLQLIDQPPPSNPRRYTPSEALAHYIRRRDRTCRFPGCNRPAIHTDLDHRHPHQAGGQTTADNLHCLCRHHHRLKHRGGWTVQPHPDTSHTWTSPTGRTYRTEPVYQT